MTRDEYIYWRLRGQTSEVFSGLRQWKARVEESILDTKFTEENLPDLNHKRGMVYALSQVLDEDSLWEKIV